MGGTVLCTLGMSTLARSQCLQLIFCGLDLHQHFAESTGLAAHIQIFSHSLGVQKAPQDPTLSRRLRKVFVAVTGLCDCVTGQSIGQFTTGDGGMGGSEKTTIEVLLDGPDVGVPTFTQVNDEHSVIPYGSLTASATYSQFDHNNKFPDSEFEIPLPC